MDKDAIAVIKGDYKEHQPISFLSDFKLPAEQIDWLKHDLFALLCGVISDQSMPATRAWQLPANLRQRIGEANFNAGWFTTHEQELHAAIKRKPALHRFPSAMAHNFSTLGRVLTEDYAGDAAQLLSVRDYAKLVMNMKPLAGVGIKKINALLLILTLDLHRDIGGLEDSQALFDVHLARIISEFTGEKVTATSATNFCRLLDPAFPARVSPYLWRLDRQHQTLHNVIN